MKKLSKTLTAFVVVTAIGLAGCAGAATAPAPAPTAAESAALPATLAPEISVSEAAALRDAGAYMLDVREQSEWDEFHMPGATLIPLGTLASRVDRLPKDKPIVVVCRSGNRSQAGRDILTQAGFTNVTSMAGGMNDWRAQGLPVATGP